MQRSGVTQGVVGTVVREASLEEESSVPQALPSISMMTILNKNHHHPSS